MFPESVVDGGGRQSVPDWPVYTAPEHTELLFISSPKRSHFCSASRTGLLFAQCKQQPNPACKSLRSDAIRHSVNGP
jgi:hypothetical protein